MTMPSHLTSAEKAIWTGVMDAIQSGVHTNTSDSSTLVCQEYYVTGHDDILVILAELSRFRKALSEIQGVTAWDYDVTIEGVDDKATAFAIAFGRCVSIAMTALRTGHGSTMPFKTKLTGDVQETTQADT